MLGKFSLVPKTRSKRALPQEPISASQALEWIKEGSAPQGLKIEGRLYLRDAPPLPDHTEVSSLLYGGENIAVPRGLRANRCVAHRAQSVGEDVACNFLDLTGASIKALPKSLKVSQSLDLSDCTALTALPEGLEARSLNLSGCVALEALPAGLKLDFLDLSGCSSLRELPDDLEVRGQLNIRDCAWITKLPSALKKVAQLDISGCMNFTRLPDDIEITSWIDIGGSGVERLPEHLKEVGLRWRGVPTAANVIFEPQSLKPDQILAERNSELRRVMMERFGYDKLMEATDAQVLDVDKDAGGERKLLRIAIPDDEDLVCVSVRCPSTGHHFMLRVPPTMQNCAQAIAWTAGFQDPSSYKPQVET